MRRITQAEELTDEVVRHEIRTLLKQARANVANRKAQLVLGVEAFEPSDDALVGGPIGQKMQRIFDHVSRDVGGDQMEMAELCEEVLEFLWSSMFAGHYQIPDSFWDTPLGFAIYEVIGRVSDAPDSKELTSTQAAKYLGISQPSLHRLTQQGKVPMARKVGIHARYRVGELKQVRDKIDREPARS